jgi:hypothetical protein
VISQTRLLESVSFALLRRNRGAVTPTILGITAIVGVASGILDGVSMIGLTIRILVIILFLAGAESRGIIYAVTISTVVTTVCGMWLAYGEPPNLIMKSNLHPLLNDAFFLRYCAPLAAASYLRHGEVRSAIEHVEDRGALLQGHQAALLERLRRGEPLGAALVAEGVPEATRRQLLGEFLSEGLAATLDRHYVLAARGDLRGADRADDPVEAALAATRRRRLHAQLVGGLAFVFFIGLLVSHTMTHHVRLFYASSAGFAVAFLGIVTLPRMRRLALREGRHEYAEYYFLFPLFFSITLLQTAGFFDQLQHLLTLGIERIGTAHVAFIQFAGATFLSAILDNNVVADFAARALIGLRIDWVHLFAMAQIAGYALGGCWTHIGCAQSVVAYAFIHREVDESFTPFQWVRVMTPILTVLFVLLAIFVYLEALLAG